MRGGSRLEGVARTCEDAARGKLSAVEAGYYDDGFARCFAAATACSAGPLINRGHYIRVAALDSVCRQFLRAAPVEAAQIISLGAGLDTRFWQLSALRLRPRRYIEIDQQDVVEQKLAVIRGTEALLREIPEGSRAFSQTGIASFQAGYMLCAADICDPEQLADALASAGWDPDLPTLLLAECVLVYLPPEASERLLQWFAERASRILLASYEQIGPHDAFGRTMLENLRRRNCPLLGLNECPDLKAQIARCKRAGWDGAEAEDLLTVYERTLVPTERTRVERLEHLDEVEEWQLMLRHYCVLVAVREIKAVEPLFDKVRLLAPIEGACPACLLGLRGRATQSEVAAVAAVGATARHPARMAPS